MSLSNFFRRLPLVHLPAVSDTFVQATIFLCDADTNFQMQKPNIRHDNIDALTVIEREKFPLQQWVLFNGYVMHGVEHVQTPRVDSTMDLKPNYFNLAIVP